VDPGLAALRKVRFASLEALVTAPLEAPFDPQSASAKGLRTAASIHSEFARDLRSALMLRRCTSADVTGG
jgi:flagellar motor switch protein FliM